MPTYIYSKRDFIKFIQEQVKDDEVIAFTNSITGSMSFSKKKGTILPMQFAPDAFNEEGVGHIAFGETSALGVMIIKKERLSEKGKKAAENIQNS